VARDGVDGLLHRIRGLVQARERLPESGAPDAEVAAWRAEIARLQGRLAEVVRRRLASEAP
jgi:hypothetical protein